MKMLFGNKCIKRWVTIEVPQLMFFLFPPSVLLPVASKAGLVSRGTFRP